MPVLCLSANHMQLLLPPASWRLDSGFLKKYSDIQLLLPSLLLSELIAFYEISFTNDPFLTMSLDNVSRFFN